jgi:MarR-like DNA-binding transcriptional regulator SgrR of sgrS sRNA
MDAGAMVTGKGAFSYKQNNINWLQLDANHRVHIERLDVNTARVYVVDKLTVQVPMQPLGVTVRNSTGEQLPILANNFITAWSDSYELLVNGVVHIKLEQQKQQAIKASGTIEA